MEAYVHSIVLRVRGGSNVKDLFVREENETDFMLWKSQQLL